MTGENDEVDEEVLISRTRKNTLVQVVRIMGEGKLEVRRHQDNRELATFSFNSKDRGSVSRERAYVMAECYLDGYLHGVSDYKGES